MVKNYEALKLLSEIIIESKSVTEIRREQKIVLEVEQSINLTLVDVCKNLNLNLTQKENIFEITFPKSYFLTEIDFMSRYSFSSEDEFDSSEVVIFNFNGKLQVKSENDIFNTENSLIYNFKSYKFLLDYLSKKEEFLEHINSQTREMILVGKNSKKNAVIKIRYNHNEARVAYLENLAPSIELIFKSFKDKEFIYLFRDRVVDFLSTNISEKDSFFLVVKNLPNLLKEAEIDFQFYLKKFNFENIKNRFRDDRIKYFDSLDKHLDNIGKQIAAVPLSFSAVAFAEYQVKDTFLILWLIFFGILIYTYLSWKMLNLSLFDVEKLEEDLVNEYENIKKDYQDMLVSLDSDFAKIWQKIDNFKDIIKYVKYSLIALLCLFILFSIYLNFFTETAKVKDYILTL
ncbi:hypothetical protein GCM10011514_16620 [Emticicia aquatilis]|uniref:Uncharacterized protein n=1 Tax=Emticicia aquatilis TaxID=1537369 RepID=A0A916YNI9_9BACT|nr:hypothetical protein [Emticicia aquatilis]GGD53178.1 hypothetical protein GCM10011514_16620 [Emticicia aquatilis]